MKLLPQIELRVVFLIFFCAAVGLTCASAPPSRESEELRALLTIYVPSLNVHYALLTAAATVMVFGLIQQVRFLVHWKPATLNAKRGIHFARVFAITWRIAIATTIVICLLARVLILRQVVRLPSGDDWLISKAFPDALLEVAMIVVLSDSIRRWCPNSSREPSTKLEPIAWIVGIILALLVLPEAGFITYLVHIAVQGIERAQPLKLQRPGVYPDQLATHFRLFWISFAAAIAVALAASLLVLANRVKRRTKTCLTLRVSAFLAVLVLATAFSVWFYRDSFPYVSPDMASVGFGSNFFDFVCGSLFALIIVCACAYRLALIEESTVVCDPSKSLNSHQRFLHESPLCLAVLFGAEMTYFIESIREIVSGPYFFGASTFVAIVDSFLNYTDSYIPIAIFVLSLQLCWIRWRRRRETITWRVWALDRTRFGWNSLGLTLLFIVAVPTIAIYCFTFWLGPWYMYGS